MNPVVTLWTDDPSLFPTHRLRAWPTGPVPRGRRVAVIACMRDEASSIPGWAADLLAQTRLPDEVVIADDGSSDGSAALLVKALAVAPFPVRVVRATHPGISAGRNAAIRATSSDILAITDLGVGLPPTWLERLNEPFELAPQTQVVGGFYVAVRPDGGSLRRRMFPTLDRIDPATFLPASRSLAVTRGAWQAVGGYPEWLPGAGEDTWFATALRREVDHHAFAPEAVVLWFGPATAQDYWRKARWYASGDGRSGHGSGSYARSAAVAVVLPAAAAGLRIRGPLRPALLLAAVAALAALARGTEPTPVAVLAEYGAQWARVLGWLEGRRNRSLA